MIRKKYNKKFFNRLSEGGYKSAQKILPVLVKLIHPNSAIDLGCGTGAWLKVLSELGVKRIIGVEGDYIKNQDTYIPKIDYIYHNLENKFCLDQRFDMAISLEVGEHLSFNSAPDFVASLCSLSDIVLFSAAIPGQEGTTHINEQFPEYWAKLFEERNYLPIDFLRKKFWEDTDVELWYKQNILLFVNKKIIPELPEELQITQKETNGTYLFRVHPSLYLYILKRKYPRHFLKYWWGKLKESISIILKSVS